VTLVFPRTFAELLTLKKFEENYILITDWNSETTFSRWFRDLFGLPQRFSVRSVAAQKASLYLCFPPGSPVLDPATWLAVRDTYPEVLWPFVSCDLTFAWVSGSVAHYCHTWSILLGTVYPDCCECHSTWPGHVRFQLCQVLT